MILNAANQLALQKMLCYNINRLPPNKHETQPTWKLVLVPL